MEAFQNVKTSGKNKETIKKSKKTKEQVQNLMSGDDKDTSFFIGNRMKALLQGLKGGGRQEESKDPNSKGLSAKEKKEYVSNPASFQDLCLKNSMELKDIGLKLRPAYLRNRFRENAQSKGKDIDYSKDMSNENSLGFGGGLKTLFGAGDWGGLLTAGLTGAFGITTMFGGVSTPMKNKGLDLSQMSTGAGGVFSFLGLGLNGLIAGGRGIGQKMDQKEQENEETVDEMDDLELGDVKDAKGNIVDSEDKKIAKTGFRMLHDSLFKQGKSLKEVDKEIDNEIIPEIRYQFAMNHYEDQAITVDNDNKILIGEKAASIGKEKVKTTAAGFITAAISARQTSDPTGFGADKQHQQKAMKAGEDAVGMNTLLDDVDKIVEDVMTANPTFTSDKIIQEVNKQVDSKIIGDKNKIDKGKIDNAVATA